MTVNLSQPMRNMSVSQRQMCEIAKAISYNSQVIVLDEPTSSLTVQEVAKLFEMMRMLKEQGISLIYISHKMDEIFEICDEISVLRDGNLVMTKSSKDTNMNELITAMVGRSLESRFPPVDNVPGGTILSVQHLSTKFAPHLQDVTFDVREGEIFGLYGLVGAGRTEMATTIFGMDKALGGRVLLNGRDITGKRTRQVIAAGLNYVPEDRHLNGLFKICDVTANTTSANLFSAHMGRFLLDHRYEWKVTQGYIEKFRTKVTGQDQLAGSLSGGNQQKIVIGRSLSTSPGIVILDEPTRGIDAAARGDVYHIIHQLREQGVSVLLISSDMEEMVELADRVVVMYQGRLNAEFRQDSINQDNLTAAAFGILEKEGVGA